MAKEHKLFLRNELAFANIIFWVTRNRRKIHGFTPEVNCSCWSLLICYRIVNELQFMQAIDGAIADESVLSTAARAPAI
ncbi:MAG TPA: hypothetical protein VF861_16005 [Telluria sp.]